MTFGEKIKSLRKEQKLTLQDLAKKSKLSAIELSNLENGKYKPSGLTVAKLSKALDYDYDALWELKETLK